MNITIIIVWKSLLILFEIRLTFRFKYNLILKGWQASQIKQVKMYKPCFSDGFCLDSSTAGEH